MRLQSTKPRRAVRFTAFCKAEDQELPLHWFVQKKGRRVTPVVSFVARDHVNVYVSIFAKLEKDKIFWQCRLENSHHLILVLRNLHDSNTDYFHSLSTSRMFNLVHDKGIHSTVLWIGFENDGGCRRT